MNTNAGTRRLPALRPLACGVMLALSTLPMSSLMAKELDGSEEEIIEEGDAAEEWLLKGNSSLIVNAGSTNSISATNNSKVVLTDATVTRLADAQSLYALSAINDAVVTATGSTFIGGIWAGGNGSITLTNSTVTVDATEEGQTSSYGFSVNSHQGIGNPTLILDGTTVTVSDIPDFEGPNAANSGLGGRLQAGELILQNNARIIAANVGVLLSGDGNSQTKKLTLKDSHIQSGRGAGLMVTADSMVATTAEILITDGSTIAAGDGNLLRVTTGTGVPFSQSTTVNFTVDDSDLDGNILYDDHLAPGSVNVTLRNNASITGRFFNVTTAGIDGGSTWTLTGDSNVDTLNLGSTGTVALSNGGGFNTLTVGEFNGDGGTLAFRSQLEGDTSLTDKLVIDGDANGSAKVTVTNAGGQGAPTSQGIELIRIGGLSNAAFALQGRATGGLYDYFLFKDDNGNWYLRSQLPDPTEPDNPCEENPDATGCTPTLPVEPDPIYPENPVVPVDPPVPEPENPVVPVDPPTPERPMPVLRPETGAYLANQAAMGQLLQYSAQDRSTVATGDGVQTWANISNSESRMDAAGMQRLRTQQSRLQVGAELGAFDGGHGRVGALLSAGRAETTSRSTVTGYRATGKVEGGAAGVYANWSNDALTVGASVQHGRFSNQVQGEGVAQERYDTRAWQTSIEAGYRFDAGSVGGLQLSLQPQLQLTHTAVSMDTHVESNGTVIADAGGNGLSTRVGLRLEGQAATGSGRFLPYLALDAHHAAKDVAVSFDGEVLEGGMPRRRVDLQLGGQLVLGGGFSAWGGVGASHGTDNYRDTSARVGVSYQW